MMKNYSPISLFSVVRKISEKLLNERLVDHSETCNSFSNFQYAFRSLRLTVHLLTVVSDRIALAFDRSWTSEAVVRDVSKALGRVWGTSLFHKFKSYRILGWVFDIIPSFFFCKRQLGLFWVRKWLVNFNARKTQLILFDCSNIFVENSSLKKMGLSLSSTLKSGFYIVTSAKIAFKKMEALIHSMKLHSSELQYKILDKLQKQLLALLVLLLLLLLNSWFIFSPELVELLPSFLWESTCYSSRLQDFYVKIHTPNVLKMSVSTFSFVVQLL